MEHDRHHANASDILLVITLLDFCKMVLGHVDPAEAAMVQYVIDDLLNRDCS